MSTIITPNNFKDYIGREVNPECNPRFCAFLTPDTNILLSYFNNIWYFKSPDEINTTEEVWQYEENDDWGIIIYLID